MKEKRNIFVVVFLTSSVTYLNQFRTGVFQPGLFNLLVLKNRHKSYFPAHMGL